MNSETVQKSGRKKKIEQKFWERNLYLNQKNPDFSASIMIKCIYLASTIPFEFPILFSLVELNNIL